MLKRKMLLPAIWILVLLLFAFWTSSWAQCPEDPNDNGICDTMYVETYPSDTLFGGPGHLVRVPVYVTHDLPNPEDSIVGFCIPLCYTHTNPSKYCSLSFHWNNTYLYPSPDIDRSIFRHLPGDTNWMMALSEHMDGSEWDNRLLDLDGISHFRLSLLDGRQEDQRFCEGSRVLLATMTFRVEDTMTVCVDSCFWPPVTHLKLVRSDLVVYIPRHNMPYCFSMSYAAVGDVNLDGVIDIGDVVYIISYLFREGPPPFFS